ncbi:hypothetical protein [Nocardia sp. CNY236]|uniref:hypothetical protein n=1 Tax=Nocardia sp. CNY236 TaxID=1169152 RepID=UPI00040CD98B|nr:hypothetical protein [Nocardia sp. CNY236]
MLADAAGAATKPSDKAIAVAAKIVMILVDIAHPPNRVNFFFGLMDFMVHPERSQHQA